MKFYRLDKYIFLLATFVLLAVLLSILDSSLETFADISTVFIAFVNLCFVAWAAFHNKEVHKSNLGEKLLPISFELELVGNMLISFSGENCILTEKQLKDYSEIIRTVRVNRHLIPQNIKPQVDIVLGYSILFVNQNRRMIDDETRYSKFPDGGYMNSETPWIWENRSIEAEKMLELARQIEGYFEES